MSVSCDRTKTSKERKREMGVRAQHQAGPAMQREALSGGADRHGSNLLIILSNVNPTPEEITALQREAESESEGGASAGFSPRARDLSRAGAAAASWRECDGGGGQGGRAALCRASC